MMQSKFWQFTRDYSYCVNIEMFTHSVQVSYFNTTCCNYIVFLNQEPKGGLIAGICPCEQYKLH